MGDINVYIPLELDDTFLGCTVSWVILGLAGWHLLEPLNLSAPNAASKSSERYMGLGVPDYYLSHPEVDLERCLMVEQAQYCVLSVRTCFEPLLSAF